METEYDEYTLFMENDDLYEDDDTRMVQDEEDHACEREDAWEKYETVENEETDDDRIDQMLHKAGSSDQIYQEVPKLNQIYNDRNEEGHI